MAGDSLDELLDQLNAKDRTITALNAQVQRLSQIIQGVDQGAREEQGAWAAWVAGTAQLSRKLLTDAETWHIYQLALHVIADRDAVIARLREEMDAYDDHQTLHCLERDAARVMDASRHEAEGTVLRATDTGREWVLRAGMWELKT